MNAPGIFDANMTAASTENYSQSSRFYSNGVRDIRTSDFYAAAKSAKSSFTTGPEEVLILAVAVLTRTKLPGTEEIIYVISSPRFVNMSTRSFKNMFKSIRSNSVFVKSYDGLLMDLIDDARKENNASPYKFTPPEVKLIEAVKIVDPSPFVNYLTKFKNDTARLRQCYEGMHHSLSTEIKWPPNHRKWGWARLEKSL